jgi:hypothetical protein
MIGTAKMRKTPLFHLSPQGRGEEDRNPLTDKAFRATPPCLKPSR